MSETKIIPAGTYIKISVSTGYCGMDTYTMHHLTSDWTDEDLSNHCWDLALANAEMYGIEPEEYRLDGEEDSEDYSDNIEGSYEIVNPAKHSGETFEDLEF